MNFRNPIKYISVTFQDIIRDINEDSRTADAPYWFKVIFAGVFTLFSLRLNILVNQLFTETVESRDIAEDLFAENDYRLRGKIAASVSIDIVIDASATSSSSYTVPASKLKGKTNPAIGLTPIQFESRDPITFPQNATTGVFTGYHQTSKDPVTIGKTLNINSQVLFLQDTDILTDTLYLQINGERYDPVDTLAYSLNTDRHFLHKTFSDGSSCVILGFIDDLDGTQYGKIPVAGLDVISNYATGGGSAGNVIANAISKYASDDPKVISVNNALAAQDGAERETIENARRLAPLRAQTHDMFWNDISGRVIAKAVPGVLEARVVITGIQRASVYVMPFGGGTASQPLLDAVEAALVSKSFFKQMILTMSSVQYLYSGFAGIVQMQPGIAFSSKLKYIKLAAALRTHETSFYIHEYYLDNGLKLTIDLINSSLLQLTGTVYSYDQDFLQIKKLLDNIPFQYFGDPIGPNDIESSIMSFVDGVKYVQMSNPTSQISPEPGEIIKPVSLDFSEQ